MRFLLLLIGAGILIGCGGGSTAGKPPAGATQAAADVEAPRQPGGTGSAEVTWKPSVKTMERSAGLKALIGVSTDGSTFVFDRGLGAVPDLQVGDVLLIKGVVARKVLAVENTGNETAILTVPAGLLDLVSQGKISVQAPIHFGAPVSVATNSPRRTNSSLLLDAIVSPASAQTEDRRRAAEAAGVSDAYGNLAKAPFKAVLEGWETTFSTEPSPGRLNIKLQFKKVVGSMAAVITGEGYLADFDFASNIDVDQSVVQRVELAYKKLNGTRNFKWEIVVVEGEGLRGNARIKLPASIDIPLYQYLGGLPLYLEIGSAVLIKPGIGHGRSLTKGAFRVTYDGYQNFRVKNGNVDSDGNMTGDVSLDDANNDSASPVGLVLAFALPRLELSIGISKVFKFDDAKEGAAKAEKAFDFLVSKTFGPEALQKIKDSPMNVISPSKVVEAAMGSDGAAFIELVTTSGMSATGNAVQPACIRTDLHMKINVGASAKAFGQEVGNVDKEIFTKDFTRVKPSENQVCNGI